MGHNRAARMRVRSRIASIEIDFGLMLVTICQIELTLGDAARAYLALREAHGITAELSKAVETPRIATTTRRKFSKLASVIMAADRALEQRSAGAAVTEEPAPTCRLIEPDMIPLVHAATSGM